VGDSIALIRRKFASADASHRLKLAEQILEYAPIQNLPFIERLVMSHPDTNVSNRIGIQETMEVLAELPASTDLVAYSRNAGSDLGVSESFSNSQVGNFQIASPLLISAQCLLPVLNNYLPTRSVVQSHRSPIEILKMASVYDFCMHLFEMQRILLYFQVEASKSDRGENRCLVLASKPSLRVTTESLKPAFSTLSLMVKIFEDLRDWLVSRNYMIAEDEVYC